MMDCRGFEKTLTELLAHEPEVPNRGGPIAELRDHAADCPECAGMRDLLEILALPVDEREPLALPEPAYWEGFQRRLGRRIADEPRVGSGRWRVRSAIAAALLLSLASLYAVVRLTAPSSPETEHADSREHELGEPVEQGSRGPVTPGPAADPVDDLGAFGFMEGPTLRLGDADGSAAEGWLFPGTDGLDEETSERLLQWLREQSESETEVSS